jgi:hypothetical protein
METVTESVMEISTLRVASFEPRQRYNNYHSGNLWIYVDSWHEGIAGWRPSLSQILLLAKTFNATLVEPTISRSRLARCSNKNKVILSDVLNRSLMTDYHPKLAACQEYEHALQTAMANNKTILYIDVCWDKEAKCKNGVASDHSKRESSSLWRGLHAAANNPEAMVVLRFHDMWQNSMANLNIPEIENAIVGAGRKVANRHLHFKDSLVKTLESKLEQNNIAHHSVIHWRAEKVKASYVECARDIVQARDAMAKATDDFQKNASVSTFFVMSSLSSNDENSWNGARKNAANSTAPQALELLQQQGILKLDETLLADVDFEDSIFYVAMDLILASKATMFATCTERCRWPKYHLCQRCNWIGNFAHLALELRGEETSGSLPCWPQTSRQVPAIERIPNEHL